MFILLWEGWQVADRTHRAVLDHEGKRFLIVDVADYGVCTSNLAINELPILRLRAQDCPEKKHCVTFRNGMSDICAFIGTYPGMEAGRTTFERLVCGIQKRRIQRKVLFLGVRGCPNDKGNCLGCNSLAGVVIPTLSSLERSHAHVICGMVVKD